MTFPSSLFLFLTFFFLGGTAANLLFMRHEKSQWEKKRSLRRTSFRFSAACIAFSLAVVSFAALLIVPNTTALFHFSLFDFRPSAGTVLFFAAAFLVGAAAFLVPHITIPSFALLVLFLSVLTHRALSGSFYTEKEFVEIVSSGASVAIDGAETKNVRELKVTAYRLPETFVIPVRRNWYAVERTKKSAKAFGPKNQEPTSIFVRAKNAVVGTGQKSLSVPIPTDSVVPAVYTLRFKDGNAYLKKEL